MINIGQLTIDQQLFELEEAKISGIFQHSAVVWDIEIYPPGEQNYLMLNCLFISNDKFLPKDLEGLDQEFEDELYEHTVVVEGNDGFLNTLILKINNWTPSSREISVMGEGELTSNGEVFEYEFAALAKFEGIHLFETSQQETEEIIRNIFNRDLHEFSITYEQVPSGLKSVLFPR